jgi:SARP family transcriptional regulator, regulator of embCAB operon
MEFRILGPLQISQDGRSATPSAQQPRRLIALLLVHANHVVPVTSLMSELWGGGPQCGSHLTTLHTYVVHLRKLLAAASGLPAARVASDILVTQGRGYLLRAQPGEVDLDRFSRLLKQGTAALSAGASEEASGVLQEALDQWSGMPLADVRPGRMLEVEIERMAELRLHAMEIRIEADLNLSRHRELLADLVRLAAEHPYQENIHAQLMVALYRCGRRHDALEAYRLLRRDLVEELGLEPSPKMRQLQQAILAADPALDGPLAGRGVLLDRLSAVIGSAR